MKKIIVLVPHPDDEINLAAGLYYPLKRAGYHIVVCVTTNGDFIKKEAKTRFAEALKAKEILGYDELLILGYGDGYVKQHIYETCTDDPVLSIAGYNHTYNIGQLKTCHYLKYGCQAKYLRNNYKADIKELILDIKPDIILCVDIDKHSEHRTLSLLFDEAFGEIVKTTEYRPIILKKFAYIGVYDGVRDYFCRPMRQTMPSYGAKMVNEQSVFPYLWDERISIKEYKQNYPLAFWKSPIFKALLAYHSQRIAVRFPQICNSDIILWQRRVDSLTYRANIISSTGEVLYLNDFKIVDFDDVCLPSWNITNSTCKAWVPACSDISPKVTFYFNSPSDVEEIVIYQSIESKIDSVEILFDNGFYYLYHFSDTYKTIIDIQKQINVSSVTLIFSRLNSSPISINEIEIYSVANFQKWILDVDINSHEKEGQKTKFLYRKVLWLVFLFFSILYIKKDVSLLKRLFVKLKKYLKK